MSKTRPTLKDRLERYPPFLVRILAITLRTPRARRSRDKRRINNEPPARLNHHRLKSMEELEAQTGIPARTLLRTFQKTDWSDVRVGLLLKILPACGVNLESTWRRDQMLMKNVQRGKVFGWLLPHERRKFEQMVRKAQERKAACG